MSRVENLDQIIETYGPHLHDAPHDGWRADRVIDRVVPTHCPYCAVQLYPLIKRNGRFERASWDEALDLVVSKFRELQNAHGNDSIGIYSGSSLTTEKTYKRFPLKYDPQYWGMVFPLGMYTVCTIQLARAINFPPLLVIPRYFIYLALLGWTAVSFGLLYSLLFRNRATSA